MSATVKTNQSANKYLVNEFSLFFCSAITSRISVFPSAFVDPKYSSHFGHLLMLNSVSACSLIFLLLVEKTNFVSL